MTNQFDEISSDEMEEMTEDSSSVYHPDSKMQKKGYEWDSTGLYFPYTYKHESNPDPRDIYIKMERIPDVRTKLLKYTWVHKKDGEFKTLNFFRRDVLPVEEDIDSGGKASINKALSFKGNKAGINAEKGSYKSFMNGILEDITKCDGLEVFKDLDFEFPIIPEEDEEDEELSQANEDFIIRLSPELDDEALQDAMEVMEMIEEYGLIAYWDSIVNKFHKGNHTAIYIKHLGGFNIIRGKGSYFIYTTAKSNVGKSLEDKIAFLILIPDNYIFKKNQMSLSSFSRYSKINVRYFERMIIYFGDLGNKKSYEKIEDVFDAIKTLITEKEFSRDLTEGNASNRENETLELKANSIGAVFQTVRFDFLGDENEQIASRSIESTPFEANEKEVLKFLFALNYRDSFENKAQREMVEEVKKYHNYLLWLIKEDITVINPYRSFFMKAVKNSDVIFRDFTQILELFDAFCVLTHGDCFKTDDGLLIASIKQLKQFISQLSLENVLPPVESNFLRMLLSKGNKSELKVIDDADDSFNPIQEYENEVMEHLGFRENFDGYEYETFGDLEYSKKPTAIAKLLEIFRLGGTGTNHKDNVFFRVNDLQRVHSKKRAYKDIDDVGKLLDKLYSNLYIDKLDYKDNRGRNIYYLTKKSKEILQPTQLEMEDLDDANEFLKEQMINFSISPEKYAEFLKKNAESEVIDAE